MFLIGNSLGLFAILFNLFRFIFQNQQSQAERHIKDTGDEQLWIVFFAR
jgi:hypothetical protein